VIFSGRHCIAEFGEFRKVILGGDQKFAALKPYPTMLRSTPYSVRRTDYGSVSKSLSQATLPKTFRHSQAST
jgi:hypothetical protein